MLCKLGVDISRLERGIRRALNIIDKVYKRHGEEAVITSTYESNHSVGSLHYADDAIDIRKHRTKPKTVADEIRKEVGNDYDVVLEKTHIHVEFDPPISL